MWSRKTTVRTCAEQSISCKESQGRVYVQCQSRGQGQISIDVHAAMTAYMLKCEQHKMHFSRENNIFQRFSHNLCSKKLKEKLGNILYLMFVCLLMGKNEQKK